MKTPIWVYIAIAVLSIGAGVAIAGIPDTSSREPTIIPPVTTDAASIVETVPETTVVETTVPVETTTTVAATTTTSTTTTTLPDLPERDAIEVTVANGADIGGVAGQTAEAIAELGYINTITRDGVEIVSQTFVYTPAELEDWSERLASELGLPGGRVRPIDQAPEVENSDDPEVILYLGEDIQLILVSL